MAPQKERLFCWTVYAYRKPGISEEEYHEYMSKVYAPVVKDLIVKHGIVSWVMVSRAEYPPKGQTDEMLLLRKIHNTSETRMVLNQLVSPQFNGTADYDCIIQGTFRNIEDIMSMRADAVFKKKVAPDYENFTDAIRSKYVVKPLYTQHTNWAEI
jgi:hypothetical protein